MIKNYIFIFIIGIVFGIIFGSFIMYLFFRNNNFGTQVDTILVKQPAETIYIDTGKAKIIYRSKYITRIDTVINNRYDTVYIAPRFIAVLDTIIKKDTVNVKYFYPGNFFSLLIKPKPDSIRTITITKNKLMDKNNNSWWKYASCIAGGMVLGFIIAK